MGVLGPYQLTLKLPSHLTRDQSRRVPVVILRYQISRLLGILLESMLDIIIYTYVLARCMKRVIYTYVLARCMKRVIHTYVLARCMKRVIYTYVLARCMKRVILSQHPISSYTPLIVFLRARTYIQMTLFTTGIVFTISAVLYLPILDQLSSCNRDPH